MTDRNDQGTNDPLSLAQGLDDAQLDAAIRRERHLKAAPRLGQAAKDRITARMMAEASASSALRQGRQQGGLVDTLRGGVAWLLRPPAWQALAAASVAGIIAGLFTGGPGQTLSPEEEFTAYFDTNDVYTAFLEEDI